MPTRFLNGTTSIPIALSLGGDAVDLGGFKNLVHNHDLTRPVRLRFEVLGSLPWYGEDQSGTIDEDVGGQEELDLMLGRCSSAWVEVAVAWCVSLGAPKVTSYEVGLNGQFLARTRISDDSIRAELERIDLSHPVLAGGGKLSGSFLVETEEGDECEGTDRPTVWGSVSGGPGR